MAPTAIPTALNSPVTTPEVLGIAADTAAHELFLRLAPGNRVRVLNLTTRAIVREFTVENLPSGGNRNGGGGRTTTFGADLAVRARDHHLFFIHPTEPLIIETTADGKFVRIITPANVRSPANGIAYDDANDRFLLVIGGDLDRLTVHRADGAFVRAAGMSRTLHLTALAFDSAAQELYAPLYGENALGVFDPSGEMTRSLPVPTGKSSLIFDVLPGSTLVWP